jgi:hypothetical protein
MGSDAKKSKIDKFAQSAMEFIFYTVFTVIGLSVVPTQRWIWPTANWWNEWETPTVMRYVLPLFFSSRFSLIDSFPPCSDDLKCYYLLYGARYTQAFISVLMEHKRKDFVEMIVHHLTTMIVILASFYGGYYRNGAAIMLLFDPADVPLHAAKLVKYIGFQGLADCFFVLFMLIFFLTRIVIFPYVVWSSHFEANSYFPFGIIESICVGSLYVLAVLNAFWFYLILKVLHGVVTKGKAEDVRSDDEDDDGDDKKKRK